MTHSLHLGLLCGLAASNTTALAVECRQLTHQNVPYSLCVVDLGQEDLEVFYLDRHGQPLKHFDAVQAQLSTEGRELIFAVNGGMFEPDLSPVGLLFSKGTMLKALNTKGLPGQSKPNGSSSGNFYHQPNGVFWVQDGKAHIADTLAYQRVAPKPHLAVQSGPLLLQHRKVPQALGAFNLASYTRNGVCVLSPTTVAFLNSDKPTSIKQLALAMQGELKCDAALYLDGCRTALFSKAMGRNDLSCPTGANPAGQAMGAMLGVARKVHP